MKSFKYAMQKSYEYMKKEIDEITTGSIYSEAEMEKVFYACGTCLHWILDFAERVKVPNADPKYISAFRFANNTLKHDSNLFEFTEQTGGFSFPMSFPLEIENKEIRWKTLNNNGGYESQHENYKEYLEGKIVVDTCKEIIELLLNYEN